MSAAQLDLTEKYMRVMTVYGRDLESIRKIYQKHKNDPQIPRNLPPIAGKIAWARQLYRKIETPMKIFKNKPEILKVSAGSVLPVVRDGICQFYNKTALNVNSAATTPYITLVKSRLLNSSYYPILREWECRGDTLCFWV